MEMEMEMEMEVGDCTLWHYLIFCETFVSDDYENVCFVCNEPILGYPVFTCLECAFVQHKSCTQLPNFTKTNVEHDFIDRHHLILREKTEDGGQKKGVCVGCGKLASSPAYRCSIPHCAFHLHKSCDQLSHVILHNAHPDHTLILAIPPTYLDCDICNKDREKKTTLLYGCHLCSFYIDNKCASRWDIIESERKLEVGDCSLWHYLIFCEEFVSNGCENNMVCLVCEESILGHPSFKCLECGFVQHKSCTQLLETEMDFWHDITDRHHLILQEETKDDGQKKVVCSGCGKLASSPTYKCSIPYCAFHLHKLCDQLSHAILHNAHPNHTLILALPPLYYICDVCNKDRKKRTTLLYGCRLCDFDIDNKCASHWDIIETERKLEAGDCSLWHYLIFCEEFVSDDYKNNVVCWVCEESILGHPTFKCLECGFVQHKSCPQLPNSTKMNVWHDIIDRHHLILQEETKNDGKEKVVCAACGKLTYSPTYRCSIPNCAFYLHKSCDHLSHAILHNAHQDHILILALPPFYYSCDVCSKDRKKRTTLLYGCRLCDFDIDNKCASHWDIIESERKTEAEDCSIWHYLIFCEKFVSNDCEEDIVCWVCEESVLGNPTFKCLECNFVQHKSCTQLYLAKMYIEHRITDRHHLIEEMENTAKEIACMVCRKTSSGPAYRCSFLQCTFHLHRSCDQLYHFIHRIEHPEHTLILKLSQDFSSCDLCGESVEKGTTLLYHCSVCQFHMDKNCASPSEIIDVDCDQHVFIAGRKLIQFTCEACGVETKAVASQCSICRVLTHHYCTRFPRIIRIKGHIHFFSRTYCLHQVKKLERAICKLCCKKVKTEYGAYYCQVCDYIIHMKCAKRSQDKSTISLEATQFEDYRRHLVYLVERLNVEEDEVVNVPSKINHNNHPQHELILRIEDSGNDKRLFKNDKRCAICMQFILFFPYYSCEYCNIFVHKRCAQLLETLRRPLFKENPYSLSSHLLSSADNLFCCHICKRRRHGLSYKSGCEQIDVQCFLIPEAINHKSHEHFLHVSILPNPWLKQVCTGCGENIIGTERHFMCLNCKFWLCFQCATLPLVARYRHHPHLLELTNICKDDGKKYYCLICEEKLDLKYLLYSCANCNFSAHIQCVIGSSLKCGRHEHPLTLVEALEDSSLECHLCEKSIEDYRHLKCPQCKFNFHFDCYY